MSVKRHSNTCRCLIGILPHHATCRPWMSPDRQHPRTHQAVSAWSPPCPARHGKPRARPGRGRRAFMFRLGAFLRVHVVTVKSLSKATSAKRKRMPPNHEERRIATSATSSIRSLDAACHPSARTRGIRIRSVRNRVPQSAHIGSEYRRRGC